MSYHDQYLPEDAHGPYRQLFANDAARTGDATVYSAQDVSSRIKALQLDTLAEYVLTADTPTWSALPTGGGGGFLFGEDYQHEASNGRSTTTSNVFQTKTTLTTPALTGTYRVAWTAVVDQSFTGSRVEARLRDITNNITIPTADAVSIHEPKDTNNRIHVGGFCEVEFFGGARTFEIQYREQTGDTAGISSARIEIWRVG